MDLVLRHDRDRAVRARGRARTGRPAGALIGWLARRAGREPVAHRGGVGAAPTRSSPAGPFGGFSWGEVGYAFHDIAPARARRERRRRRARHVLRGRAQRAPRRPDRGAAPVARRVRAGAGSGIAVIAAVVVVRHRHPRRAARRSARCASRSSRATTRTATSPTPRCDGRYLPNSHFDLARPDHRSRRPDRVPRVEHGHRRPRPPDDPSSATTSSRSPAQHARVGARQRDASPRRPTVSKVLEPRRAVRPRRARRGHLRQAPSRAVRRVRAVPRRARAVVISACSNQVPRDFEPGPGPGLFDVAGIRVAHDHLLRVGVRLPGPAARARRRAGDRRVDEQPLLPAVGELGPARRDRPDARRRDRAPGRAGRDLGDHRGRSTPTAWCTSARELFERTVLETTVTATTRRDAVRPLRGVGDLACTRGASRSRRRASRSCRRFRRTSRPQGSRP